MKCIVLCKDFKNAHVLRATESESVGKKINMSNLHMSVKSLLAHVYVLGICHNVSLAAIKYCLINCLGRAKPIRQPL